MNIIEKRRRKAWAHATMVIMNKVIREASTGTIFIYGETLYGKDYFLTPDDALDAVLVTMGVLRKLWERDGVRPSKRLFAEVCPDRGGCSARSGRRHASIRPCSASPASIAVPR